MQRNMYWQKLFPLKNSLSEKEPHGFKFLSCNTFMFVEMLT